ncbi:FtsX-like permease family protein [Georgenia sp. MJ206]|uniref:FtsX-like permease family protein n=1 Tax=Georgenia wangjunii TaxID=3117730 RepID=UPI002F26DD34
MRAPALLARRARAQAGALTMLTVLVAAIAAICAGTIGSTRAAEVAGIRASFTEAGPTASGLMVRTRLGADPTAQAAAVEAAVGRLFAGVEVDLLRSLRSEPVAAAVTGEEVRLVLGAEPDLATRATVTGTVPGDDEVLLPDSAAAELGLAAGDVIDLDGAPVTVTGTWTPADADDGAWFADPTVTAGTDGTAYGPVLTTEATLVALVDAPFVRWTLHPDPAVLTRADLPVLAAGAARIERVLGGDDGVAVRGLGVTGDLGATVAAVEAATSTASAVGLVPVVLLAVIALVALVQVVRLLGQSRAQEVEILVARGAAPGTLTRWAALEAAVVAAAGAAAGTALAAGLVARLDGGRAQLGAVLLTGAVVAAGALAVAVLAAGAQVRSAAGRMVTDRSGRLRDAAALGSVLLTGVAAVLATWQLRRFGTPLVIGADGQTQVDVLAVAALAAVLAALSMLGLTLLGPLARSGERLAARSRRLAVPLAARQVSRRLRAYAVPVVLLSLAAGAATTAGTFAGTTATQREQVAGVATGTDVRVLLPARPTSRLGFPSADAAAPYAGIDGVSAAASVLRQDATLGQTPVVLTALPSDRVADVVRAPAGLGLAGAVARLVPAAGGDGGGTGGAGDDDGARGDGPPGDEDGSTAASTDGDSPRRGIALPAGAASLELDVRVRAEVPADVLALQAEQSAAYAEVLRAQGATEEEVRAGLESRERALFGDARFPLATAVWVADTDGALSLLDAGSLVVDLADSGAGDVGPETTVHTRAVDLPGDGAYRVVGVEVTGNAGGTQTALDYEVTGVRAVGGDAQGSGLAGPAWELADGVTTGLVEPEPLGALGVAARVGGDGASGRFLARLVPAGASAPVPAVLTTALAERASLAVGDEVPVAVAGPEVDLTVVALLDAVPGGLEEHAVLVDQGVLGAHLLRERPNLPLPTQVWLAVDEPDAAADVAAAALDVVGRDGDVEVAGAFGVDSTGPVREAFWLAAAGSAVLALTGAAAVALALTRERRGEVMVLRALGQPPAGQARVRAGELLGVGAFGVLLGAGAGWLASWLLVPTLARAASTDTSPLALAVGLDAVPTALLLGTVLAGLLSVGAVVAARVRAQARDAEYREEIR